MDRSAVERLLEAKVVFAESGDLNFEIALNHSVLCERLELDCSRERERLAVN